MDLVNSSSKNNIFTIESTVARKHALNSPRQSTSTRPATPALHKKVAVKVDPNRPKNSTNLERVNAMKNDAKSITSNLANTTGGACKTEKTLKAGKISSVLTKK